MIPPNQFHEVAILLAAYKSYIEEHEADNDPQLLEAMDRTVVSRAYYAVFSHALLLAITRGFDAESPDKHSRLWRWYGDIVRRVGSAGFSFRDARVRADYKLQQDWDIDSDDFIQQTARFVGDINQAIQVCDAMKSKPAPEPPALPGV